jgi:diguanylate cyclase (GGDEF)-like protein
LLTAGGITALQLRKSNNKYNIAGLTLSHLFAFLYLILGAVTCVIDQLVTSSINPFLIANVAVALFVIMRPLFSLFIYTLSYLIFFFLLPLTQHSSELISTVRVNGLSASAVGLGLALVMWRTNALSALQKQLIQAQNEELEKKNRQLKHLARTDMMTGLYNRTRFTEFVEMEVERLKRTGETSSLIILDLDDFKNVNDLYGHPNGDTVLKLVAGVIKGQLRSTDILCRFGGEEFAVLLPGTAPEGALNVAEKIRGAIEGCSFTGKLESLKITASLGLATLGTNGATSFDTAYQKADQALYNAKGKGRNRIEFSA